MSHFRLWTYRHSLIHIMEIKDMPLLFILFGDHVEVMRIYKKIFHVVFKHHFIATYGGSQQKVHNLNLLNMKQRARATNSGSL
jgi:hypothetical protein